MFCRNCGNKLKEDEKFCNKCGTKKEITTENGKKKEKEDNNLNGLALVLSLSFLFLFLFFLIIFFFHHSFFNFNAEPFSEDWTNKYYIYLKDIKEKKMAKKAGIISNIKDAHISFCEISDEKDPIMILNYKKNGNTYSNVYYIEKEKVNVIVYHDKTNIELLYNKKEKSYDYYFHIEDKESDTYQKVIDEIDLVRKENYTFFKEDKNSFDEIFEKVTVDQEEFSYDTDMNVRKIKKGIQKLMNNYKTKEELLSKVNKLGG